MSDDAQDSKRSERLRVPLVDDSAFMRNAVAVAPLSRIASLLDRWVSEGS